MNTQFIMTAADILMLAALFLAFGLALGFAIAWRPEGPRRPGRLDADHRAAMARVCDIEYGRTLGMVEVIPDPAGPLPPNLAGPDTWTFSEISAGFDRLERNVCAETRPLRAIS